MKLRLVLRMCRLRRSARERDLIGRWRMKAPIFGKIVKLNLFGQFARTLGTLLQNGVPVLTALKITEQVLPNRLIKEAVAKTREAVTDALGSRTYAVAIIVCNSLNVL